MTNPQKPLLEFPCSFPLKVFGKNTDKFEAFVVSIAQKHIANLNPTAVQSRPSKEGKYLSVTVTFIAENQAQLDALYQELSDSPRVLMIF